MQNPDNEKFETYLKGFLPVVPEPVPMHTTSHASRRSFRVGEWLAGVAAIIIVGTLTLTLENGRVGIVPDALRDVVPAEKHTPLEPLTMRSANAWLANAPSFKAALNDLAFRSPTNPIEQGKQSAVAVLSKEKVKL